jgi:hypothetical protein
MLSDMVALGRLGTYAAHPEPVPESSSGVAVPNTPPEDFPIHRDESFRAVPLPVHAARRRISAFGPRLCAVPG